MPATGVLSEYERTVVRNLWTRILQTKEGRDLGRFFTVERSKKDRNEESNMPGVKREILDILSVVINELYTAPAPKTGGN